MPANAVIEFLITAAVSFDIHTYKNATYKISN